jgi:hypothetical protein
MPEKADTAPVRPPESNAALIAAHLVYHTVDLDGTGLVNTLSLLQARAEQVRTLNQRLIELDRRVFEKQVTTQEEYNAELLDGLYETTCLKWFLASTMKELAKRLEGEVYGAQVRCCPIRQITFTADGQVESFLLDSTEGEAGGARGK